MSDSNVSQFRGDTFQTTLFEGIVATETEYDYDYIDWHYHENPYFSLVTAGNCREINKRGTFDCTTDSLLFHNYQDPHCNKKWGGISRHFQIELTLDWCSAFEIDPDRMPASSSIHNPKIKLLFYNIYREAKLADDTSSLTIDSLLLRTFEALSGVETVSTSIKPRWVKTVEEILHDSIYQTPSLREVSRLLDVHPAHLSRDFARYFRCNFSEYVRRIKVERAVSMLRNKKLPLADVAASCGFADQSHFIRCFKEFVSITPKAYRKLVAS
jgi:AraC family transcriptional regulator